MATTAQEVFDMAIHLMDEQNENTGETDTVDTAEYKSRTLSILNVIRGELYPFSDTFEVVESGKRPISERILDFETPIGLDDYICESVMPYGLAAHLLMEENPVSANFFQQRYDELKSLLSRGFPAASEDIDDVYSRGRFEYNEFGAW